jgi:hypothetical protein
LAKCSVCNARKAKRQCRRENGWICTECCGRSRQEEHCHECGFYREIRPKRPYAGIHRFSTKDMESDFQLQSYADTIEGALCFWDHSHEMSLSDASMLSVVEMLLDKHYYRDPSIPCTDDLLREGYDRVVQAMSKDIADVPQETIVKILGVIHFVARRRTRGGREHFDVLQRHVGLRVGSGMRLLVVKDKA